MSDSDNLLESTLGITDEDVASNSYRHREKQAEEKAEVTEITTYRPKPARVVVKEKPSFSKKLKIAIFGEDVDNVPEFVFFEWFIPRIKAIFFFELFEGIGSKRRSYDRIYDETRGRNRDSRRTADQFTFDDYLFESSRDVHWHIDRLASLLDNDYCDVIKVADVCTEIGKPPRAIDHKWGWRSTRGFRAEMTDDGDYILVTPPARPLD